MIRAPAYKRKSTTTGQEPRDKKQKMDSGITTKSNRSRSETSNTRTYLMKGKAVAATPMNTSNANKVAARSVATSMNGVNKVAARSVVTSMNAVNKVATRGVATSMNAVNKVAARGVATSMNGVNNVTTRSVATSMNAVNKVTTRSVATSKETANKVTTTSPATSKKTANKITTTSAATSIKTGHKVTVSSATRSMNAAATNNIATRSGATTKIAAPVSKLEQEQSSKPIPVFVCDICTDSSALEESFSLKGCHHKYCKDCVNKYVASRLGENIAHISCPAPDCKGDLEPDHCRSILPQEVFVMWCEKLCENTFQGFSKLYCPYKDCSGMLIDDGTQMIKESECPHCRRLFCAQCKAPWHSEIDCEGFQKLHEHERQREDIMLMNLAETQLWKRCPNCKFYVERTDGCRYIKCRCGAAFCYACGNPNIDTYHYCNQCQA